MGTDALWWFRECSLALLWFAAAGLLWVVFGRNDE